MPKQGQFARSHRQTAIKSIRRHHPAHGQQRVISRDMASDFIIIRYRLTTGKHLAPIIRETGQRFLQELISRLLKNDFDFQRGVLETLTYVNSRVPWQFFFLISHNWSALEHFIQRELPALPLKEQVILKNQVSQEWLDKQITQLLAQKVAGITLINQSPNTTMQGALVQKLTATIVNDQQINWGAVEALLAPLPFPIAPSLDAGTQEWLRNLQKINA